VNVGAKYKKTGVFATKAEVKRIITKANAPMIWLGGGMPTYTFEDSWEGLVHSIALKHGLPEIPGFYGINTKTREFLKT
jgi:hypothetical protein